MASQIIIPDSYVAGGTGIILEQTTGNRDQIDTDLTEGTDVLFFQQVRAAYTGTSSNRLTIASSQTQGLVGGHDLSDQFESAGSVTIEVGTLSVTIEIGTDLTEPYTLDRNAASDEFADAVSALDPQPAADDFTITLDDGAGVTPDDPLTLAHWDDTGLTVDFAALVEVAAAPDLYKDSDFGGSQTPTEGELGLGSGETVISRLWWNGTTLRFNDKDNPVSLNIGVYYSSTGAGADQTIYLVTGDADTQTEVSFDAATYWPGSGLVGGGWVNWGAGTTPLPTDVIALLNGLSAGDRLIVAGAEEDTTATIEGDGAPVEGEGSLGEAEGTAYGPIEGDGAAIEGVGSLGEAEGTALGSIEGEGAAIEGEGSLGEAEGTTLGAIEGEGAAIEGEGSLGEAEGTTLGTLLSLSHWDDTGLTVDFAALIEVEAAPDLYRDTDRGGSQTPIEGELGFATGETLISRLNWSSPTFRFNDNNNPVDTNIGTYYGPGGDGNGQTIYLVTGDADSQTEASFDVATYVPASRGGGWVNWGFGTTPLPAAVTDLLSGLSAGDRLIIAGAEEDATIVEGDGAAIEGRGSLGEAEGTAYVPIEGEGAAIEGVGSLGEAEGEEIDAVEGEGAAIEGEGSLGEAEGTTLRAIEGEGSTIEGEGSLGEAEGTSAESIPPIPAVDSIRIKLEGETSWTEIRGAIEPGVVWTRRQRDPDGLGRSDNVRFRIRADRAAAVFKRSAFALVGELQLRDGTAVVWIGDLLPARSLSVDGDESILTLEAVDRLQNLRVRATSSYSAASATLTTVVAQLANRAGIATSDQSWPSDLGLITIGFITIEQGERVWPVLEQVLWEHGWSLIINASDKLTAVRWWYTAIDVDAAPDLASPLLLNMNQDAQIPAAVVVEWAETDTLTNVIVWEGARGQNSDGTVKPVRAFRADSESWPGAMTTISGCGTAPSGWLGRLLYPAARLSARSTSSSE